MAKLEAAGPPAHSATPLNSLPGEVQVPPSPPALTIHSTCLGLGAAEFEISELPQIGKNT